MAAGLIIGLLMAGGGVFFLIKKKKVPGFILTIIGGLVATFGLFILWVYSDSPGGKNQDPFIDVVVPDGMTVDDDKITYITEYVTIVIQPDTETHPEDTVSGKTDDGAEWSTTNKDGTEAIHMKVDEKTVTAKVETKKDSEKKTNEKADAGKAAAAVSALVDTGYKKGKDNYNHNYAIWYVEPAQCLVYYPAQLTLSEVKENNTAIFTDTKSKAKLKISLDENNYSCMDDVESFIANTEYNKVLASGTDWFSCETKGKSMTEFSVTGLGQEFAVNVDLTYENKYDFVFEELRSLIQCKFVEGGKWVSNERVDTAGKKVPALQDVYVNGIKWKLTQYYIADGDFIQIYPNIFSKVYYGGDGLYFTDPVTGAYIKTFKQDYGSAIDALAIDYGLSDYTRIDEDIIRGYKNTDTGFKEYHYVVVRDALEYHTIMYVPYEYDHLYEGAAAELSLKVPGDDVGTFEMQDLYFKDHNCFVTVPLQFKYDRGGGDDYYYYDSFNGLDLHIKFSQIPESQNRGNIFDIFEVTAEDENLIIGQNTIKWHNEDGLFLGGQGNSTACYVEIVAVDAERAYLKSWDRFDIRFEEKAKAQSIVDEVKKDVKIQKIKDETISGKSDAAEEPFEETEDPDNAENNNTNNNSQQNTGKPKEEKTPIIAEPIHHELPDNDKWMEDKKENVVLWYKDYDDYKFMTTTAYKWFLSEQGGAAFSHGYKCTLLEYMNVILKYNEYDLKIKKGWVEKVAVPMVDGLLEEWYHESDPPVGSMLGDEITSVFEAYCQVLGIDVPDYVTNAMEPTVLDDEPKNNGESEGASSGESYNISINDIIGTWATDEFTGAGEQVEIEKNGYTIYQGDRELDTGWYSLVGQVLYIQSFNKSGDDYDLWVYDPVNDQIIIKRYGLVLHRIGGAPDEDGQNSGASGSSSNSGTSGASSEIDDDWELTEGHRDETEEDWGVADGDWDDDDDWGDTDSGETEWIDELDGPLSRIDLTSYKTTGDPLFEPVGDDLRIGDLKDYADAWDCERYGNSSAVRFSDYDMDIMDFSAGEYVDEIEDLMNRLEALGLSCIESGSFVPPSYELFWSYDLQTADFFEINYVEYYGVLSGYEEYGPVYVVISDGAGYEVSWMFENYASFPIAKGEMYVDESFVHFCQGYIGKPIGGALDAKTIWFVCQRASYIMNAPELNLPDFEDHYYLIAGDDSGNSEWFAVLAFDIDNKNRPYSVFKMIKVADGYDWIESHWYPGYGWGTFD